MRIPPIKHHGAVGALVGQQRLADADRVGDDDRDRRRRRGTLARCHVVVPAVSPIAVPGRTRAAAAAAIACFSAVCSDDLARNPGSSVVAGRSPASVAPPCTLVSRPCWVRASRSRRIVMSLTPSSVVSSLDPHGAVTLDVGGDQLAPSAGEDTPAGAVRFARPRRQPSRATIGRRCAGSQHNRPLQPVAVSGDS